MRPEINELKLWALNKMFRNGYWGHRMLNFDDFMNPKIVRRDLEKALKMLENEGLVHKKKGGKSSLYRYSLISSRKTDVENMLRNIPNI